MTATPPTQTHTHTQLHKLINNLSCLKDTIPEFGCLPTLILIALWLLLLLVLCVRLHETAVNLTALLIKRAKCIIFKCIPQPFIWAVTGVGVQIAMATALIFWKTWTNQTHNNALLTNSKSTSVSEFKSNKRILKGPMAKWQLLHEVNTWNKMNYAKMDVYYILL